MNCRKERYRCCWRWKLGTNQCAGNCWPNRRPISYARPPRPAIRRSISRPEEETSTWCGYWWITGQRWTCKTYEKRALLSPREKRIRVKSGNHLQGDGQTALHIASAEGDETLVKYFYGVRASASITDHQDRTPMHLAAENGHASIIELLADKFKASIFERTKDGSTLMHIASLNGHSECATMLFKKGVYLHMPNKRGARSIHTAAKYGHVGIISTLLQRGEKVFRTKKQRPSCSRLSRH